MKTTTLKVVMAIGSASLLAGCVSPNGTPDNTGAGALAGGASGAMIGAIADRANPGAGALIGAAAGLITGGLIGHAIDQQQEARLRAQAPQTYERVQQGVPLTVADVKAMSSAGIKDDVIISQIRNSRTVYHLSANEIIDLNQAGVSQKVIDYMVNTASLAAPNAQATTMAVEAAPPPPPADAPVILAPGPGYVWVGGEWIWTGGGWHWVGGHWVMPPYPRAMWVHGYYARGPRGGYWISGYWR